MLCLAKFAGAWGFLNNLVGNMFVGPRSVIGVTPRDFKKVDMICEKFSVTSLMATPYFLEFLLKSKIEKFPSTLKNVLAAGEPLLDLVASNFYKKFNTKVINCYGLSEVASVTSESDHHKSNSVGRPFAGVSIKIIDDQGNECDVNTSGTLFVKSPAQTIGYLDDTEATNKLLVDGWVNTNDIVSIDSQGDVIFHGRANSFVKFKSQVISLLDIESTILEIPEVNDCVVVPTFDEIGVSELTAMIVVDKINNTNIKNVIQQALLKKLEKNYVSIKNINMVDQIPRTTSMKKIRALNVASTEVK
jgi:acyl-coenzyme A synthetase/AMP-(fatty) acid ligase